MSESSLWRFFESEISTEMTRGNQRELARQKNMKKEAGSSKGKKADDKDGNRGMSLQERKQRDADRMRDKQKAAEKTPEDASASGGN